MGVYTIAKDVENEIVVEKSRFICTLKKVQSEQEAQDFVKTVKKQYWDATHNCSAYLIDDMAQHSSDDGEPSGTAGVPMLAVLRKAMVQGVVAVVTRYFGGVKLGAGGLVRAYTNSVALALQKAGKAERVEMGHFEFFVNLNDTGKILNKLYADGKYKIKEVSYKEKARILFTMRKDECEEAEKYLTELLQSQVELCYTGGEIVEVAVVI
ncbi:MAG: YigZ family protein [Phascolarctobacterium sp.]|nr:YigZ family protein [Candidatus Phascolarctobacterium caballi]